MDNSSSLSEADMARIEAMVKQSRQEIMTDVDSAVRRHVEPLLEKDQAEPLLVRIRTMLLETLEEMARRQVEPLMQRTQQMMLQLAKDVVKEHAGPVVSQVRDALQNSLEEVAGKHMQPLLQFTKLNVGEKASEAAEVADTLLSRLKSAVAQPVTQVLREEMPNYVRWVGRRALAYGLAGTFFALAGIFLLIGIVQGLQHAGVEPYLTYVAGGLTALAVGGIFLWFIWREPPSTK